MDTLKKCKITINTNNEVVNRIAEIDKDIIKYKESPNIFVALKVDENKLHITKSGEINFEILHIKNDTKDVLINLNINGNLFEHNVNIKTTNVEIQKNKYVLEFYRDEDFYKIIYEIKE